MPLCAPLRHVRVRAEIAAACCRTTVEQVFDNPLSSPMEAIHIFPLPEDGALTEVELRCGDLFVRADCKPKDEAVAEFDKARVDGQRAALLTQERDDVHTLRVTNLPPNESVTVRLVVVEHLPCVDGRWRWRFPTTIAPRYLPGNVTGKVGPGAVPDTDQAPDASRLQPPLRLNGGTRLDLEVRLAAPITAIESSLHAVRLDNEEGSVRVAPSSAAKLNKDFALSFTTGERDRSAARAWTDGEHTLVVVEPPTGRLPAALPRDAVFVVDISGSMTGIKMKAARQALKSALHGLVAGDRFVLIAFDDCLEYFAAQPTEYDEEALAAADRWVDALEARGGTEMLPAIRAALADDKPAGRARSVLFITDGQAWNDDELVAAVANRRAHSRFFTLGIDTAVNGALLKRLARAGGGLCELAAPTDDIEAVVVGMEARFGSPLAEGVRIDGFTNASLQPAAVFAGCPASLLIEGAPREVRITDDSAMQFAIAPGHSHFPLGELWARRRVTALQDRLTLKPYEEEAIRPQIVATALKYRIASRYTAFVAVERTRLVDGDAVQVVQPAELPQDWVRPVPPIPCSSQHKKRHRRSGGILQTARQSIGGKAPRKQLATKAARKSSAMELPRAKVLRQASQAQGFVSKPQLRAAADAQPQAACREEHTRDTPSDAAAALAQSQSADGSFGGDVRRTAAALLTLVLLGHTRRKGVRRRTVTKAEAWLAQHSGNAHADAALAALEAAEQGLSPARGEAWKQLCDADEEGGYLAALL